MYYLRKNIVIYFYSFIDFFIFTDHFFAFFISIFIYLFTLWCWVVDLDIVYAVL